MSKAPASGKYRAGSLVPGQFPVYFNAMKCKMVREGSEWRVYSPQPDVECVYRVVSKSAVPPVDVTWEETEHTIKHCKVVGEAPRVEVLFLVKTWSCKDLVSIYGRC